ncbi:creatininase family protein [Streptomyces sp. NPDC058284]|uniref:creatininase family protein n=1 Tax=unclassified Streptomyces TaxID=2593676 RepID=UPI003656D3D0
MRIQELTWPEYQEEIAGHVVVLPIGALEAHGPHLPLSTDTLISTHLAEELDARLPVLILPPLHYGYRTDPVRAGGDFPGMTDLRASTLTDLVQDILSASYRNGARRFLILHSHIANVPPVFDAAQKFVDTAPEARVMAASWWDFAPEETRDLIARETGVPRYEDHHAALVETSLVLSIDRGQVREPLLTDDGSERRVRYVVLPVPDALKTKSGVIYRASRAEVEIGERLLPEIIDNLVDAVRLELGPESEC